MTRSAIRLATVALLLCTLAACAVRFTVPGSSGSGKPWQLPEPKSDDEAIVFGSFVIEDKDKNRRVPNYVQILKKGKVYGGMGLQAIGEKTAVLNSGTFIAVVQPGVYMLSGFYTRAPAGFNTRATMYTQRALEFTVEPGQILYLGSYGVKDGRESLLGWGEFDIERVETPSERDQLQWLLKTGQGTAWEPKIRKRSGAQ